MPAAITGNFMVAQQLASTKAIVNGNTSLRLFTGAPTLTPATQPGDLVEPTFTGYARKNTSGQFGDLVKIADGLYQCDSAPFVWVGAGEPGEPVTGWHVVLNFKLLFAALFPAPILVTDGTPVSLVIQLQAASLSLCGAM